MPENYLLFLNVAYSFSILRPLQSAIRRRGANVAWFVQDLDPSHLRPDERLLHSVAEVKTFNPRAVFVPGNWVPDFFPGVKVQVFHGFGIEKKGHFDIRGLFDLYCTHGPLTTRPFQALAEKHGFFHVAETGWPKVDHLFRFAPGKEPREKKPSPKPVVLYAPTFSTSLCSAPSLFEPIRRLALKGDFHWLIKFHPLMEESVVRKYRGMAGGNVDIVDDPDIVPSLHAADVMLTDTSSVVSEFLLLNKPVVTYNTRSPAPHVIDFKKADQLESRLTQALEHPRAVMSAAREFIGRMHPYVDGRSSERVLAATDAFIDRYQGKLKPKPLNLFRKLKIRRRLHYYRWR